MSNETIAFLLGMITGGGIALTSFAATIVLHVKFLNSEMGKWKKYI